MTQGNTELLMPLRIETVQHDVGLDGGGRPDADLEEGVRQVTSADVEEGGVSVRQIFSFHCMKFQSSMKKIFRGWNDKLNLAQKYRQLYSFPVNLSNSRKSWFPGTFFKSNYFFTFFDSIWK